MRHTLTQWTRIQITCWIIIFWRMLKVFTRKFEEKNGKWKKWSILTFWNGPDFAYNSHFRENVVFFFLAPIECILQWMHYSLNNIRREEKRLILRHSTIPSTPLEAANKAVEADLIDVIVFVRHKVNVLPKMMRILLYTRMMIWVLCMHRIEWFFSFSESNIHHVDDVKS